MFSIARAYGTTVGQLQAWNADRYPSLADDPDERPADVHAALEGHVAGCPRCAAFVVSYREAPRILREATVAALPADLEVSLKAFLRARTTAFKSS